MLAAVIVKGKERGTRINMSHAASMDELSSLSERILNACFQLYTDRNGLVSIGQQLEVNLTPPSKQITVLLIGNHSAGKSTFINWYIGENIQKAGVAVETQGFTLVTHGRRRETLLCEGALMVAPRFQAVCGIDGVSEYFTMELSASTQRRFGVVTLVDTPGLVDGGISYPYDVTQALLMLGQLADLVFVFFDPIGQALCRRTVDIVKELARLRDRPMTFCLSKADEATSHADRQKVMVQIVQELCASADVNRQGFEIKAVFVPGVGRAGSGGADNLNQIEELCEEIDKAVSLTVQRTLNQLGRDCDVLLSRALVLSRRFQLRPTLPAWIFLTVTFLASGALIWDTRETSDHVPRSDGLITAGIAAVVGIVTFAYMSNLGGALMLHKRYRIVKMLRTIRHAIYLKDSLYNQYLISR